MISNSTQGRGQSTQTLLQKLKYNRYYDCFVYYESINRELKIRPIYECRYDERLKTKAEESNIHWVTRGTGTRKDTDEVNR